MAKKNKGVNKSAAIRELVDANRNISPGELVAALAEKGIETTTGFVSTIKSNYLRKQRGGKRKGQRGGRGAGASSSSSMGLSLETLLAAKNLAAKLGGVEEAKKALEVLSKLQ